MNYGAFIQVRYNEARRGWEETTDHQGNFVSTCSLNFGHCIVLQAEIMALTKGIDLALELQIKKLEIQLDSVICVQMLNNIMI